MEKIKGRINEEFRVQRIFKGIKKGLRKKGEKSREE